MQGSAKSVQCAIILFNQQAFFDCHEVLEDELWRPEANPIWKNFYQGWLQVAVGYHHAQRENAIGMRNLLQRGLKRLQACPKDATYPFQVSRLISQVEHDVALANAWCTTGTLPMEIRYPQLEGKRGIFN